MAVETLRTPTNSALDGDKGRTVAAMAMARAWKDANYKQRLLDDPKAVLAAEGLELDADVNVIVLENTETVRYVNLTRGEIGEREEVSLVVLMQKFLPIPEGHELRLVQSTEKTRYLVLHQLPAGIQPANLTESELMALTVGASVESVAEATTEATSAETTAEVGAEAVVVIVLT